jgi:hypothetical protein
MRKSRSTKPKPTGAADRSVSRRLSDSAVPAGWSKVEIGLYRHETA